MQLFFLERVTGARTWNANFPVRIAVEADLEVRPPRVSKSLHLFVIMHYGVLLADIRFGLL